MKYTFAILALLCIMISGCASSSLHSPCDQYATYCGVKTKINHG